MIVREERIGGQRLILGDCRAIAPILPRPDGIITDPPYGVAMERGDSKIGGSIAGDLSRPELAWMASVPSIVWGGNNFCDQLPRSTGWLVWFKHFPDVARHSQAELAWTNCVRTVRHYSEAYHGFMRQRDGWFHPTQKPVGLMKWCLNFMPAGQTILDPYMGSGPVLLACLLAGKKGVGIEVDPQHFETACRRVDEATRQADLFVQAPAAPAPVQAPLL